MGVHDNNFGENHVSANNMFSLQHRSFRLKALAFATRLRQTFAFFGLHGLFVDQIPKCFGVASYLFEKLI